jgi:hypothetical protein
MNKYGTKIWMCPNCVYENLREARGKLADAEAKLARALASATSMVP